MKKPRKVLLIGSSFTAAPIFFALKQAGFFVTVCGNDKNDPCHQYADSSLYFDYSVKENLLNAIQVEDFSFIIPTCNDVSYLSCAWVSEQKKFFGFDSYEVTKILHTKNLFRKFMADNRLPVPKAVSYSLDNASLISELTYPLLVKPVASDTGRGCVKITKPSELKSAVELASKVSRSGEVVIEEFVQGSLHSQSAFVQNGVIVNDYFVDEFCTVYPYAVDCSNYPSGLTDSIRNDVRNTTSKMIKILGLCDGLLHTQFITDGKKYWIIECMRRCPGDLYGHLIQLSTGIDYFDLYIKSFTDQPLAAIEEIIDQKFMGRHTIWSAKPQIMAGFSHHVPARKIKIIPLKGSGSRLKAAPYDKLGILFAEYNSYAEMLDITPRLSEFVTINPLGDSGHDCSISLCSEQS